jgi:hypothetical protein
LHVDSGGEADAISLTKKQIEKIKLRKLNKTRDAMNAYGEKRFLQYYVADEVVVDDNRFTNCEIMEMPSVDGKFDDIGLIGQGFLQLFTVYFDFENNLLRLYPKEYSSQINYKDWQIINLDKHNRFKGQLSDYNKVFNIGFDTGAIYINGEKGYNWIRVKDNELLNQFESRMEYDFNMISSNLITSENVKIDSLNFLIYETSEPEGVDIFLGYDFFSKYKVIIDYTASKLYYR